MNLFTSALFTEGVLPFLLVFVLVFAILQKSKILGEGKAKIDALVSLAIGLLLVGTPTPRGYIVAMVPWLAVALVVLLIFFLIYGFTASSKKDAEFSVPGWVKTTIAVLAIIFVVVLVLMVTGFWDNLRNWIAGENTFGNIIILAAVGVALWVAFGGSGKTGG